MIYEEVDFSKIFNSWYRFSHNTTNAQPANLSETKKWSYSNGVISCNINSSTYIGFVSDVKYDVYKLETTVKSNNADNDRIGVVIAFAVDSNGIEHTISALRDAEGSYNWFLVYDYAKSTQQIIDYKVSIPGDVRTNWNNIPNGSKIRIEKNRNTIKAYASPFNSTTIDLSSELTLDLSSNPKFDIFKNPCSYGYSCQSQDTSSFTNAIFWSNEYLIFFKKEDEYYLPVKDFFDKDKKEFKPISLSQLITTYNTMSLLEMNTQFTIDGVNYTPYDYLDTSQSKLCVIPYREINKSLNIIHLGYTPSNIALSKTTMKVKDRWDIWGKDLNNLFFDISATNKAGINYKLNYYQDEEANNTCDLIDIEFLKNDFYSEFSFNKPDSILKSAGLYTIDKVNYTKIKDAHIDVNYNYFDTSIKFKNAYTKVLINQIKPTSFIYYKETIDSF
jgi:hypothetical protein